MRRKPNTHLFLAVGRMGADAPPADDDDDAGDDESRPLTRARADDGALALAPQRTLSVCSAATTLMKNQVGCSLLSLPSGMGAADGTGFVPALGLCALLAIIAGRTLYMLGDAARATGASDMASLASVTLGARSSALINLLVLMFSLIADIMLICFIVELICSSVPLTRGQALLGVTTTVLTPLALRHDLSGLRFSSCGGMAAVAFTVVVVVLRSLDGSYADGTFRDPACASPALGSALAQPSAMRISWGTFVLFSMLSSAYTAHYNAVRMYAELADPSPGRLAAVCALGVGGAALANALVMTAGYATFGAHAHGLILSDYAPHDRLAQAARAATLLSILALHPLTFTGLRDAVLAALKGSRLGDAAARSRLVWSALSLGMLAAEAGVSLVAPDVGIIVSFLGALLSSLLVYVVPAAIHLARLAQARQQDGDKLAPVARRWAACASTALAWAIGAMGCASALAGTVATYFEMIDGRTPVGCHARSAMI